MVHLSAGDDVLLAVEAHLLTVLGQDSGRASVTFLGTERIDVLRFGPDPDGLVRYVTLGMSRAPMTDPTAGVVDESGPRAELVLGVHGAVDSALRRLAVLAASPAVEGVVVGPGALLDLGEPLWDGAPFPAVLVGEPGVPVPDLPLDPVRDHAAGDVLAALADSSGTGALVDRAPVRFLPLTPVVAEEAAYLRVHGADALR
ncbi:MAG: suppressor of fused domain protein, partial [Actinomycetota bacterium]|nr:suppressor of fused domain protein [Actinomycetota bacterium]